MKSYEQQLWEHTMLAINRILSPEADRRQKDNTPSLGQLLTEALESINSNPAPSLESPTHGCDTARETCGTGVTTSADVAAEISDQGAQSSSPASPKSR